MNVVLEQPNTISLRYSIKYNTTHAVPLAEVIASLSSLDVLLGKASQVLSDLTHTDHLGQSIYIERVETGSLWQDIVLVIYCQDAEATKRVLNWIEEHKMKSVFIGMLLGGALTYGATTLLSPNTNAATVNNTTTITNSIIVSGGTDVVSDEIKKQVGAAIEKKILQDKNQIAKATLEFMSPVRSEPSASISLGADGSLADSIEPAVITAIPTQYEAKKNQRFESLTKVKISLRATDIDKRKQGWAGTIDGVVDNRVSIILDPTLEPSELLGRTSFVADVEVERTYRKGVNEMIPTRIIVRKIY